MLQERPKSSLAVHEELTYYPEDVAVLLPYYQEGDLASALDGI